MKGARASLRNCGRISLTKYQSSVVFQKCFFRIEQLTMLFAVQKSSIDFE